jgi:hypothetical protein
MSRERLLLLGDLTDDFPPEAGRYLVKEVLGRDVLLPLESTARSAVGAHSRLLLPAERGDQSHFESLRNGLALAASSKVAFQFRSESEM